MPAALIVQLVLGVLGQLPEIVKVVEELRATGSPTLSPDQTARVQTACDSMKGSMNALWPK
jgi:hypothetical protein